MVQESSLAFHTRKLRLSEAELPAQGHAAQVFKPESKSQSSCRQQPPAVPLILPKRGVMRSWRSLILRLPEPTGGESQRLSPGRRDGGRRMERRKG